MGLGPCPGPHPRPMARGSASILILPSGSSTLVQMQTQLYLMAFAGSYSLLFVAILLYSGYLLLFLIQVGSYKWLLQVANAFK